jgi:hypothetical protein
VKRPIAAALLAAACLSACSGNTKAPVSSRGGGSAAPSTATPDPGGVAGPQVTPTYLKWDMSQPFKILVDCARPSNIPPLHYFLQHTGLTTTDPQQGSRAAAIVTVTATGPARWNTPDGRAPSQAYVDYLQHPTPAPDGSWPVQPNIVTPYTLRVNRVLRGAAPATVVGYLNGGTVAQHAIVWGCTTTAEQVEHGPPAVGRTYLVMFGPELTADGLGARPIVQPMIGDISPYDPATDLVTGGAGQVKLGDALKGLPPGSGS